MNIIFRFLIKFIYEPKEYVDSAGRISAITSFFIGTFLFLGFTILKIEALVPIGILYVLFCIIINLLILLILILKISIKVYKQQSVFTHIVTLITLLLNIPITIYYTSIVMEYSNGMSLL